ncbi:MAG TPA: rhomboid family intramembrane serine protease [Kofleriaceae bacterium]|nr:rhomboid family intramembrane serine protease [Kofleriaceae bacterium]
MKDRDRLEVPWATLATVIVVSAAFCAQVGVGIDGWRPRAAELASIGGGPDAGLAWRLFIAPLVHLGALHLAFNLIGFALIGPPLERVIGRARTFVVYAGGAIAGAALHVAMQPYDLSVGASGAAFAGAAALLVSIRSAPEGATPGPLAGARGSAVGLGPAPRGASMPRPNAIRLAIFAIVHAAALAASYAGLGASPDLWAHSGGAIAGAGFAAIAGRYALRTLAGTAALVTAVVATLALARPAIDWRGDLARAAALEQRFDALVPDTMTHAEPALASRLDQEVIAPLAALREGLIDDARMPDAIIRRRAALRAYLDARLRALHAISQYLATGDQTAKKRIEDADRDADAALLR